MACWPVIAERFRLPLTVLGSGVDPAFAARGWARTRVEDIASAVGVAKGTVFLALGSSRPCGAAPAGSPATSADSAAPAATSKVSQASVQYQAQPKGEQKCGGCLNFIAESNTCKLVAGQVSPEGWCSLWAKKA